MGCMQEIGDNKICPSCGFDTTEKQQAPFLPYGTILQNRYIVGAGIDTNGESTRYISHDKQTGEKSNAKRDFKTCRGPVLLP